MSQKHENPENIILDNHENISGWEFMAFLTNGKLMMIERVYKCYIFLDNFYLRYFYGLKNSSGYVFWLKKLKNDIAIALKPTGIKL